MTPFAFISYSHAEKDKEICKTLREDLQREGVKVWRDRESIPLGVDWDEEIERALTSGELTHFLVLISEASIASNNVLDEISLAVDHNIYFIIPIILEECAVPLRIYRRNRVYFTSGYKDGFSRLLESFAVQPEQPKRLYSKLAGEYVIKHPTKQQLDAAHDINTQVRLIAGPGTGKSFVIEERVRWLLSNGVAASEICVVSFTRAASRDLRRRIVRHCSQQGQQRADQVSVTTLHSLALRILRQSKQLGSYPVDPQVLDEWELEQVFDKELSLELGCNPTRVQEIRRAYEALWSTGEENPSNYIPPKKPITAAERAAFEASYHPTTRAYSCVLPGEIVLKCVERIRSRLLDPIPHLGVKHLIVDEFQDLNNTDLEFVYSFTDGGVRTYVAGDDDQSIYSFRFAFPAGIQTFTARYNQSAKHELSECFRCTPRILGTAATLIAAHPGLNRIPKTLWSRYEKTEPPIEGQVYRWKFRSEAQEARAIAGSCRAFIAKGMPPREILILISSRRTQLRPLANALSEYDIPVELPDGVRYVDNVAGRYVYGIIRVACDLNLEDYFAHRLLLGIPRGIGCQKCVDIREKVINSNHNYLDIFYNPLPSNVFTKAEIKAIESVRKVCEQLRDWRSTDTINDRKEEIKELLFGALRDELEANTWLEFAAQFPDGMNLNELRAYLASDNDEQKASVLDDVYSRVGADIPAMGFLPPKVRLMTMHGAKGLDASVVFIPGLEANIIPGMKRSASAGLILEAARLLYVSITRSRAACVLSYATTRVTQGRRNFVNPPSDFNTKLQGVFFDRDQGFTQTEAEQVLQTIENLKTVSDVSDA